MSTSAMSSSPRHLSVTRGCGRPRRCRGAALPSSVERSPARPRPTGRVHPSPAGGHRRVGSHRGHPAGRRGDDSEAHVPAQPAAPGQEARLPGADVHPRRPDDPPRPTATRKAEAVGLIGGIRGRRTFAELQRHGRRTAAGPLRILHRADVSPPPSIPPYRVAFAIPRSVGNAVVRNRARRQLREALRHLVHTRPGLVAHGEYLVVVRRAPADSAEARRWLTTALETTSRRSQERPPPGPAPD